MFKIMIVGSDDNTIDFFDNREFDAFNLIVACNISKMKQILSSNTCLNRF